MTDPGNIGKTIGKYKIVSLLGRGGMAEVYKAYQESLDRYVALKLMHNFLAEDPDFFERFAREARNVAALVDAPTVKRPVTPLPYDIDECRRVLAAARDGRNAARWTVALALGAGASFEAAARLANYAGGLVVMKRGTATVTGDELRKAIQEDTAGTTAPRPRRRRG